jgi:apolipoprotein N-acyltransferase
MIGGKLKAIVPGGSNALLAVVAAVLLILAFPDFDLWPLAFVGLVPLLIAVGREVRTGASFVLGWIFGIVFFFGTSWWLTFAPITYAAFPPALAYFLLLCVTMIVAVFPGVFAAVTARLVRAVGPVGMLAVPFVWTATEFARYWLTGNNWNALGYSQAFTSGPLQLASVGGIYLVSFAIASVSAFMAWSVMGFAARRGVGKTILVSGVFWLSIIIAIGLASIDGGERDPVWEQSFKGDRDTTERSNVRIGL